MDKQKFNEVMTMTLELGFNMGAVSMRLKMMETLMPYLDPDVIMSDLLTTRDVIKLMSDTMQDFDMKQEFDSMRVTMEGMNGTKFPPEI